MPGTLSAPSCVKLSLIRDTSFRTPSGVVPKILDAEGGFLESVALASANARDEILDLLESQAGS